MIRLKPDYAAAYVSLAKLLMVDDAVRARALFERALEIDDRNPIAWWGLGYIAEVTIMDHQTATNHYERALAIQSDYSEPHTGLANIHKSAGRVALAERHRRKGAVGKVTAGVERSVCVGNPAPIVE